jgi:hypothetical protein
MYDIKIALPVELPIELSELSDAELDCVHGGHGSHGGIVGGQLVAILAQVLHAGHGAGGAGFVATQLSFNIAAGNVTGGNLSQSTGDQIIAIG